MLHYVYFDIHSIALLGSIADCSSGFYTWSRVGDIFSNRIDNNVGNRATNIVSLTIGLVIALTGISGLIFTTNTQFKSTTETLNNPYSVNEEQRSKLTLVLDETEKTIAEALEVDKVEVEVKNRVDQNAAQGNMVDFVAVEEGKLIDGKFYFTEETLEILVTGESDLVEHISVPTNE